MRRVETIIVIVALGFYAWFLNHFGTIQVFDYVRMAGWGLLLTVSLETFAKLANTLGWWVIIGGAGSNLRFGDLFAARVAGESVDYVTPSAQLCGQFVMAMMVRRKLDMATGLSSVVIASLCEMIGQILFITIALCLSIRLVPLAGDFFWSIVGGFVLAVGLIAGFFFVQRKQPFSWLLKAAGKIPGIEAAADYGEDAAQADSMLLNAYSHHRWRLAISCILYLAAWSLGPVEIYILLRLLHQHATFEVALLVEGVGLLIERATFLIPAKLVSQEGGKALILALLGYKASVGFAVGFLRRIKEMVWVFIGLLTLMIHRMTIGTDVNDVAPSEKMVRLRTMRGEESS